VLTAGNEPGGTRIRPGGSDVDVDDPGETTGDPDAARLGDLRAAGSRRYPRMEEHGWMKDRAEPHARDRAYDIARRDPPAGVSPDEATDAITELLDSVGDTCPECPSKDFV